MLWSTLFAETAAATPWWQSLLAILIPVVGLVVTGFAIPWLRKQAAKAGAEAEKAGVETNAAIFEHVKGYVFQRVSDLIEEEYPKIAADVVAGKLNTASIKERLYALGAGLKQEVIDYFNQQGLDVVKKLGDAGLDKLIRSAANMLSPFPGKETAVALAENSVSNLIVDKGVEWARAKFLPPPDGTAQ